ncbi:hypothetical protein YC2023_099563 [Brassica napus]
MMKRIVNATATMGEIVIDTLAENIVRKGNMRETLWMIMIITKVETEEVFRSRKRGEAQARVTLSLEQPLLTIVVDNKMVGDCRSHVCAITTMHKTLTLGA